MLSDKQHILQLVALMKAHGIKNVVVCPGSRNAPIVHTLAECGEFCLHQVVDERSAGFQAIGMALASGLPTVVCVTSGSALLNLHPAVAEACYQHVSMVIISADRPEAWIGQMDGQTLPQPSAFGTLVRKAVNLPEGNDEQARWHANRLINEALLACTKNDGGPVHINVPVTEPIYTFNTEHLPEVRVIRHLDINDTDSIVSMMTRCKRRWLIIGQMHSALPEDLLRAISSHFVIFAEHLSNCIAYDCVNLLTDEMINAIAHDGNAQPDMIITLGGHIICKSLKLLLRSQHPELHWHVSTEGDVADTYCCLTHTIQVSPLDFLKHCASLPIITHNSYVLPPITNNPITNNSSSLQAMQALKMMMPSDTPITLHLANSTTVRNAQNFVFSSNVTVRCNRGVNGIEGSLSTAVGHAMIEPGILNIVVIGDLSFFYDNNALWQHFLPRNLRIMLINNSGGEIFDRLPVPDNPESRASIRGTIKTEAAHLCNHYGLKHLYATSLETLKALLPEMLCATEPLMLEFSPTL